MREVFKTLKDFSAELPNAIARELEGKPAYEVSKKVFVLIDEGKNTIEVRTYQKKQDELQGKQELFISNFSTEKEPWMGVKLNPNQDVSFWKELILDSFHLAANKKTLTKLYSKQ